MKFFALVKRRSGRNADIYRSFLFQNDDNPDKNEPSDEDCEGIVEYLEEEFLESEDSQVAVRSEETAEGQSEEIQTFDSDVAEDPTQSVIWMLELDEPVEQQDSDSVSLAVPPAAQPLKRTDKKQCHLCDFKGGPKGSLSRHIRDEHGQGGQTLCPTCNKYVWTRMLDQHVRDVHQDVPGKCELCEEDVDELRAHLREAHPDVLRLCRLCLLDIADDYQDHLNHAHFQTFNCEICNKEFFDLVCYKNHVKLTHLRNKMFVCRLCTFSTPYRASMDKHMLGAHMRNERYVCEICAKVFVVKDNLQKHIRTTHQGIGKVVCGICGKVFCAKRELANHMRLHTGDLPFQCDFCNRRFPKKYSLESHRRIHTGEKQFQCPYCPQAFRMASQMKVHGFREHGIEEYRHVDRSLFAKKYPKVDLEDS